MSHPTMSELPRPWDPMTPDWELSDSAIRLWGIDLAADPIDLQSLLAVLAPDELANAGRFRREQDRRRFIVGRGVLRLLLAAYLRSDPSRLAFTYNPCGKPGLADSAGNAPLQFNVSHTDDIVLFAFAREKRLGIDVERIADDIEVMSLAAALLAPHQERWLARLSPRKRTRAFYRCWVRREATIKAHGRRLEAAWQHTGGSRACAEPVPSTGVATRVCQWSVWDLDVGPSHCAAVVAEGHVRQRESVRWIEARALTRGIPCSR